MREQVGEGSWNVTCVFAGPGRITTRVAVLQVDGAPTLTQQRGGCRRPGAHPQTTTILRGSEVLHLLVHRLCLVWAACAAHHLDVDRLRLRLRVHGMCKDPVHSPWGALQARCSALRAGCPHGPWSSAGDLLGRATEFGVGASFWLPRRNLFHGAVVITVRSGPGEN